MSGFVLVRKVGHEDKGSAACGTKQKKMERRIERGKQNKGWEGFGGQSPSHKLREEEPGDRRSLLLLLFWYLTFL